MAEYSIYSFEVQQTGPRLFSPADGQSVLQNANHHIGQLLKGDLHVLGKKERLAHQCLCQAQHVYVLELNNNKKVKRWEGHKASELESRPGCYIIVDNRPEVCQICIENNSAFDDKSHEAVTYLTRAINKALKSLGLHVAIKQKYSSRTFQQLVRQRMREDTVSKVSFCISNPKHTKGVDTCGSNVQGLFNMALSCNAAKLKAEFLGTRGEPLSLSEEEQQDFAFIAALCAQNGYKINYHFHHSKPIRMQDTPGAVAPIREDLVHEFLVGQCTLDLEGQCTSYALIQRLDEIRKSIAKYTDEKTIDTRTDDDF